MIEKDITDYTRDEFLAMENFGQGEKFNAVIIVPTGELHDSGYQMMKFILTHNRKIVGVVGGWSDVVHINGIGGYGHDWKKTMTTNMVPRVGWTIDCLPASGCLRLFSDKECFVTDGMVLSDFEFFVED